MGSSSIPLLLQRKNYCFWQIQCYISVGEVCFRSHEVNSFYCCYSEKDRWDSLELYCSLFCTLRWLSVSSYWSPGHPNLALFVYQLTFHHNPCGLLFWPLYFEVSEVSPFIVICLSYPILRHSSRKGVLRAHYISLTMYFWEQIDWPALEPPVLTRLVYIGCQYVLPILTAHQFEYQGIWWIVL